MSKNQEEMISEIAKLILTNKKKMIKEEDLIRLYDKSTSDFDETFKNLYEQFNKLGFELIKSKFQGNNYYVLTSEGKDDNITPSQYGSLALIAALSKEVNDNIKIEDAKEIFKDQWDSAIKPLLDSDYLRIIDNLEIIKITPIGRAVLKEILPNLSLDNLLDMFVNNNN